MPDIFVRHKLDTFFWPACRSDKIYPLLARPHVNSRIKRAVYAMLLKPRFKYAGWLHALKRGEEVIFHDKAFFSEAALRPLLKYHQQMRVYTWDPVGGVSDFILKHRKLLRLYSHDRHDCRVHGFKFQSMVYHRMRDLTPASRGHDLVFLGGAKNRLGDLDGYYRALRADFDVLFHVYMRPGSPIAPDPDGVPLNHRYVPYSEYLGVILASKGILDIMQRNQDSLTLRAMESIFYRKKLVTTYRNIVHEAFYHPANIMVVNSPEELDKSALRDFLDSDYVDIDPDIVNYYEFDNWLSRF